MPSRAAASASRPSSLEHQPHPDRCLIHRSAYRTSWRSNGATITRSSVPNSLDKKTLGTGGGKVGSRIAFPPNSRSERELPQQAERETWLCRAQRLDSSSKARDRLSSCTGLSIATVRPWFVMGRGASATPSAQTTYNSPRRPVQF